MREPAASPPFHFTTVILAAGASSRMGQPKLLLPWGETSILDHLVRQWRSLEAISVAVVLAKNDPGIENDLEARGRTDVIRILNPDPSRGMFSSVQCAAAWESWDARLTHFVLSLGDQPHVLTETLGELLRSAAQFPQSIWQPAHRGRARHPVVFPRSGIPGNRRGAGN